MALKEYWNKRRTDKNEKQIDRDSSDNYNK